MMLHERGVTFEGGHTATRRVCRNGRSLIGELIRCSECSADHRVVDEGPPRPMVAVVTRLVPDAVQS